MPPLRPPAPCIRALRNSTIAAPSRKTLTIRTLSSSTDRNPIPYVPTCPQPTCACAPTPPDLDIDRKTPLLNTMASYSQHVLINTGKEDWSSRIEDEQSAAGDFIRGVKGVVGKGGEGFDPFNNILLTACSFPASREKDTTTVLLFPAFKKITAIPNTPTSYANLASAYLKATHLHPMHAALSPAQKALLQRDPSLASRLPPAAPITRVTVLICGHNSRDARCGILGPILRNSFTEEFARRGIEADVGLISHIGGHKFAGNVIIYVPPDMRRRNALAGCGVWYGRVGTEHVEGVVGETVGKGRIVGELFRGGITGEGGMLGRVVEEQIKKERGEDKGLKLRPRARG